MICLVSSQYSKKIFTKFYNCHTWNDFLCLCKKFSLFTCYLSRLETKWMSLLTWENEKFICRREHSNCCKRHYQCWDLQTIVILLLLYKSSHNYTQFDTEVVNFYCVKLSVLSIWMMMTHEHFVFMDPKEDIRLVVTRYKYSKLVVESVKLYCFFFNISISHFKTLK